MKALNARQKKLLMGLLAVVLLIVALLLVPLFAPKKEKAPESIVGVIPEADLVEDDGSKTGSYRNNSIGDYWDSLEESPETASPSSIADKGLVPGDEPRRDSRKPAAVVVDDIFGDYREASDPPAGPAPARPSGSSAKAHHSSPEKAQQAGSDPAAPVQESTASSDPEPVKPRPQVKRSGAVSSLDEDVATDLGNGFSTLDGTDRWVGGETGKPYRCMFTRDEKVKSGQRVTIRLLEDLIVGTTHIPRNTHLQGVTTISDRMELSINSLDMGGRILTFHFEAFDTDGGKGIYCSDLSQTQKEITEQGVATASTTLNSRLGRVARDAASVGASIVRSKSGEATVSVPAGYTFYIIEQDR